MRHERLEAFNRGRKHPSFLKGRENRFWGGSVPKQQCNSELRKQKESSTGSDLFAEIDLFPDINDGHLLRCGHNDSSIHMGCFQKLSYGDVLI